MINMSALTLEKMSYKYEGTTKDVLKNISMDFEAGKLYAIMGKSGAGKSTVRSLLSGLDTPTGGTIFVGETDMKQLKMISATSL